MPRSVPCHGYKIACVLPVSGADDRSTPPMGEGSSKAVAILPSSRSRRAHAPFSSSKGARAQQIAPVRLCAPKTTPINGSAFRPSLPLRFFVYIRMDANGRKGLFFSSEPCSRCRRCASPGQFHSGTILSRLSPSYEPFVES